MTNTGNKPTRAGMGRPQGALNKTTAALKEAILMAAEMTGEDKAGKGGLVGYCAFLAKEEPRAFASLLGRVLPMQVTAIVTTVQRTKEQRDAIVAAALRADS
ncbi:MULTISPECIES: hypothetical protein [unclassified Rhizobium]|uniref:hypothetical protein n=1 Tax=unclassified Rhizobium TaxID=2613769 RepID=UPI00192A3038|nr:MULTISPECIES: hypothetical protein [unclassified Rhizobium]